MMSFENRKGGARMYGEALRNCGICLTVLSAVTGAASAAAYIIAGRRLRVRLEADYGKVCTLPRSAWETARSADTQPEAGETAPYADAPRTGAPEAAPHTDTLRTGAPEAAPCTDTARTGARREADPSDESSIVL